MFRKLSPCLWVLQNPSRWWKSLPIYNSLLSFFSSKMFSIFHFYFPFLFKNLSLLVEQRITIMMLFRRRLLSSGSDIQHHDWEIKQKQFDICGPRPCHANNLCNNFISLLLAKVIILQLFEAFKSKLSIFLWWILNCIKIKFLDSYFNFCM